MNVVQGVSAQSVASTASSKMAVADCDIHPQYDSVKELYPFLEQRWMDYLENYGPIFHQQFISHPVVAKVYPRGLRPDAKPAEGRLPGSDIKFMAEQHLDPNNVKLGMLLPLPGEQGIRNSDFATAFCAAVNDWQFHNWTSKDDRLRAAIVVAVEDPIAAAKEIDRWAGNPHFVQVALPARAGAPFGHKKFWPIYEATCRAGLRLCAHPNYSDSDLGFTSSGWPSFYIEEMSHYAQAYQAHLASMLTAGVFERFPSLRMVLIEGGMGWLPSFGWRMDKLWPKLKSEVPGLTRLPSELIRERIWITSQPIEEPADASHLKDVFDWIGWDRVMFSSDYPHWDTDDPSYVLPFQTTPQQRSDFFLNNALKFYGIEG